VTTKPTNRETKFVEIAEMFCLTSIIFFQRAHYVIRLDLHRLIIPG
jgi:hypothetical protein